MSSRAPKAHNPFHSYDDIRNIGEHDLALSGAKIDLDPERFYEQEAQFWCRTYVRTLFGLVEGLIFNLKQSALAVAEAIHVDLSEGEKLLLSERNYELNDKGGIRPIAARLRLRDNVLFTLATYAKAHGITYPTPVSDHKWASFQRAIVVRDRLMHPKRGEDLTINGDEMLDVFNGGIWVLNNIRELTTQGIAAYQQFERDNSKK